MSHTLLAMMTRPLNGEFHVLQVNLGGDAGSEGDTSESECNESVPRARLDLGARTVCEVATLDAEPSALDRPPKAPAMLAQPIEEHEVCFFLLLRRGSFFAAHQPRHFLQLF